MKTCASCKETKNYGEFHNLAARKDGYDYYCKVCRADKAYLSKVNQTKTCSLEDCDRPFYAKELCRMHHARVRRNGTVDRLNSPYHEGKKYKNRNGFIDAKAQKKYHLKRHYQLSIEEYELRSKDGCEICGDIPNVLLHVDHDHSCCPGNISCGACVRGLLCPKCNTTVSVVEDGTVKDYNEMKDKAIQYVEMYKKLRS